MKLDHNVQEIADNLMEERFVFTLKEVNIAFELWGFVFCLIAAVCVFHSDGMEAGKRRYLLLLQIFGAQLLLMDAIAWWFRGVPGRLGWWLVRLSNFWVFFVSDVILFCFHGYVCSFLFPKGEHRSEKLPRRVSMVYGIAVAGMLLVLLSQFTNLYYYFDEENYYHRNPMHPLSLVIGAAGMILDVSLLLQFRYRLKWNNFTALLSYIVLPAVGTGILLFYYGASLINIGICIPMIFMFVVSMVEQSQNLAEQSRVRVEYVRRQSCYSQYAGSGNNSRDMDTGEAVRFSGWGEPVYKGSIVQSDSELP